MPLRERFCTLYYIFEWDVARRANGVSNAVGGCRWSGSAAARRLEQRVRGQDAHGRRARAALRALPRQHGAVRVAREQQLRVRAVRDAARQQLHLYDMPLQLSFPISIRVCK